MINIRTKQARLYTLMALGWVLVLSTVPDFECCGGFLSFVHVAVWVTGGGALLALSIIHIGTALGKYVDEGE